ncbi:NAD-dependent epimerase/dehydratase family protein [Aestuariicella sp. G3-2]|uniref:NAD-dependent epimerase/dehydratase family protein n=1 Tax=Pseudomaricurvus albidus TaxID=2842452 RepID=UPI001C0C7ECE|nr:NAD-dependent epimerase/dehydratase family protein [Aestuariicella albida]
MRIAVTGANGYVGTALCKHLLNQGAEVIALIREGTATTLGKEHPRLQITPVNYQSPESLENALIDVDVIIHLIAKTHAQDVMSELEDYRAINVDISKALAQAAIKAKAKRLVFLSSIKVNGESTDSRPFQNTDQPAPTTAYGISKMEAEEALKTVCNGKVELVIIRPPLVYSPDAKGNISTLKKAITKGLPLPLGRLCNKRDIVDLPLLCEYLYKSCIIPDAAGKSLLVCNNEPLSTTQLIRRLGKDINQNPRLLPIPASLLKALGAALGKQEQIDKLCGNLQVNGEQARQLLKPHSNTSNTPKEL